MNNITFDLNFVEREYGSVLITCGGTKVICAATIKPGVPFFLKGTNTGWLHAEYSLLPFSCKDRVDREAVKGKQNSRTVEIQRFIGRSLRACVDLYKLGERTIIVDCDVLQADGGTRAASITAGCLAIKLAITRALEKGEIKVNPFSKYIAGMSLTSMEGRLILDPSYLEDSKSDIELNIVMDEFSNFIEIQCSGEKKSYTKSHLDEMLSLGECGIIEMIGKQKKFL